MITDDKMRGALLKLSKEHRLMLDYAVEFDKLAADTEPDKLFPQISMLIRFMERDLQEHFEMEEKVFFRASLVAFPEYRVIDLVLALQKEHGTITAHVANALHGVAKGAEKPAENWLEPMKQVTEELKQHAKTEIEKFFPLIEHDHKCQMIIKDLLLKH
jgi:hypothetical protein